MTTFVLGVLFLPSISTLPAQLGAESVDRIVVTARDIVISDDDAAVISAIESRNALLESLSIRIPNFLVNEAGGSSFNDVYSVRGLGNTPNFSKQAVVLYVDDVPSSSTFTNFTDLMSPSTIEVLRGPQGDLFGKNAEAGLINIQTKIPGNAVHLFAAPSAITISSAVRVRRINTDNEKSLFVKARVRRCYFGVQLIENDSRRFCAGAGLTEFGNNRIELRGHHITRTLII